jgi:hypothetical protein
MPAPALTEPQGSVGHPVLFHQTALFKNVSAVDKKKWRKQTNKANNKTKRSGWVGKTSLACGASGTLRVQARERERERERERK